MGEGPVSAPHPGFLAVVTREVNWFRHDRAAILMVLIMPLLAFGLLAGTFRNAVIRDLGVDIVDQDRSRTSALFIQAVNAAPNLRVVFRSDDLNNAMHAVRAGKVIATVYIPRDFERDLLDRKRPQVVIFANKQFYTPGNIAAAALQSSLGAAVADIAQPMLPRRQPRPASWSSNPMS
jgi:ABC-2 type transport system permease protein